MKTECQVYRQPCDNSTPGGQEQYEQATPRGQDTLETSILGTDATTRKKTTPDGHDEHEQSIEGGQEHLKHQPLVDSIKSKPSLQVDSMNAKSERKVYRKNQK